ncbi:eukaryotic protein [Schizosaccharomyces japonicus yFS275]|uniref:Eukaryotic protein n=1 Tax=Schizosaccharomyces japonicus (strain yFS275 / FY16936) TaxID=402676 RepID=B6JV17_SCHJY|nr:eukaryotic protein [Schizosaccharomyces japonicus yFS275]EEB05218.2 eukaryotic protein [Schizosaccharomyces japonicus yFS275]
MCLCSLTGVCRPVPCYACCCAPSFPRAVSAVSVVSVSSPIGMKFFDRRSLEIARQLLRRYPKEWAQGATLPLLDLAQRQQGNFVPQAALREIADMTKSTIARVRATASQYEYIRLSDSGSPFRVCTSWMCEEKGAQALRKHAQREAKRLDVHINIESASCLGGCHHAPVLWFQDRLYENMSCSDVAVVLKEEKVEEEAEEKESD